jgi:DNA helicase-2/ATP-dependent DNA helicase PcrA
VQLDEFHRSYAKVFYRLNDEKRLIVDAPADAALHVVAGPGTGKTATLVARILKLVLVDSVPPSGIVATTFTKKAAHELRSRILEVGLAVQDALEEDIEDNTDADWLGTVDINQIWTGTTDSLCQELLTQHRSPGQLTPVVADEFVSKTLMLQDGIFGGRRYRRLPLKNLLSEITANPRQIPARMRDVILDVRERTDHDQLNLDDYVTESPTVESEGRLNLVAALDAYRAAMDKRYLADYAEIEAMTLQRLRAGALKEFTSGLHALFVDEY